MRARDDATRRQLRWDAWLPRFGPGRSRDRAPGWVAGSPRWPIAGRPRARVSTPPGPREPRTRPAPHPGNLSRSNALAGLLVVLWVLALASGTTLRGGAHALPVIALFVALLHAARARR